MSGSGFFVDATKLETVEELFGGSELGRAFLTGLGKSQRDDDLDRIFTSLKKLETHTGAVREEARVDAFRDELKSMSDAISQTRNEIAAIKPDTDSSSRIMAATEELDAITTATERATSDILGAAERIQAATQGMREGGIDDRICELLDNQATNIFMACSFQDITGQRVQKVVNLLRYLEQRINTMVGLWTSEVQEDESKPLEDLQFDPLDERPDAHLLSGPAQDGEGVSQDDVDRMLDTTADEPAEAAAEPAAETAPAPEPGPDVASDVASEGAPEVEEAPVAAAPAPEPAAEASAPEPAPAPASEPEPVEEPAAPTTETVDQDDIDAMFG